MNEGLRAFDEPVTGTDLHLGWCVPIGMVVALVLWHGLWIIIFWDD